MRLNEQFIEILETLSSILQKKGDTFRSRAYKKAVETITSYPSDIYSVEILKGQPGIGKTIMEKLTEYMDTGKVAQIEIEKQQIALGENVFTDVYGIGPKTAEDLVSKGVKTIKQLRENQHLLNDKQKIGLKYYEDIIERIPRSEINEYQKIFQSVAIAVNVTPNNISIVGSYRRGNETSGDIDVIITSENKKTFTAFVDLLIKKQIIIEVLSRGPSKCLVICKLNHSCKARRVDFLFTGKAEYPFSILYFTGSKTFNTVMRQHALNNGFTMNEYGLYQMINGKKGDKINHIFHSEKDIFDYLQLEYKEPTERGK